MMLGVPVPNTPLCLTDEVEAALLGQVSEVTNEVCDDMFIACAATFLENCHRFRSPRDVVSFVDHAHNPQPECRPKRDGREAKENHPTSDLVAEVEQNCHGRFKTEMLTTMDVTLRTRGRAAAISRVCRAEKQKLTTQGGQSPAGEERPSRQVMVIGAEMVMGRPADHSSHVVYFWKFQRQRSE
jgi:hypothetical protein